MQDSNSKQYTIAVIDDEPQILEAMSILLTQLGCSVYSATSGEEIHKYFDDDRTPDIVIADYRLKGGETGSDIIREFRQRYDQQLPAILITGDISAVLLQEFQNSNIKVLHKPVGPKDLLTEIEAVASGN